VPQPSAKADGNKKSYRIILTATKADGNKKSYRIILTATEADGKKKSYRIILTAIEADGKRRVAATGLTATESYLEYVLPLPSASADGLGTPPLFFRDFSPGQAKKKRPAGLFLHI
jgi:uncharacterized protein YrzB (UPF0473 family)